MLASSFYELDEMEQIELIWDSTKLHSFTKENIEITLYENKDLFIEVYKSNEGILRKIDATNNLSIISNYIGIIDLDLLI